MKRIKLTHGTARVADNVKQETIDALNRIVELAYNHDPNMLPEQVVSNSVCDNHNRCCSDITYCSKYRQSLNK